MRAGVALAVFVKTPGLSPVKTRLAEGLGRERAEEFYHLSVAAVEATVAAAAARNDIAAYWAVAEEAGLANARWQRFPRIHQGSSELGERLGRVFEQLQRRHDAVIAIGGDSPQITPELIGRACRVWEGDASAEPGQTLALGPAGASPSLLGRCHDGGFYLVGTNRPLPSAVWRDVPYSTFDAASQLAAKLTRHGPIVELRPLADVDRAADLTVLRDELRAIADPSAEQLAVLKWIDANDESRMTNDEAR